MANFSINFKRIVLLLGDILLLALALWLTLELRYWANYSSALWQSHWSIFWLLYLLWLPIFYAFNLYDWRGNSLVVPLITNLIKATIANAVIAIVYFYLISPDSNLTPKTILGLNLVATFILLFIWRRVFFSFIKIPGWENNFVLIGWDPLVEEIIKEAPELGYQTKALFDPSQAKIPSLNIPVYRALEQLPQIIRQEKVKLIVLTNSLSEPQISLLFKILPLKINFIGLTNFYERLFQKIPLAIISQTWFLENLTEGDKALMETAKRIFDIILALLIGIISLPFIPLISLIIYLDSRGEIFFCQTRTGQDGKNFTAVKFRTMYRDSERKGPQWASANDPRITRVGRFLRKLRIDEIPQLWNILIGEMSFVGPRPERPEFINELIKTIPFYRERLLVKPGLTGWAQINFSYASSVEDSLKKLQYDLYYIKNRSFFLDLGIILKTINTILKGAGR